FNAWRKLKYLEVVFDAESHIKNLSLKKVVLNFLLLAFLVAGSGYIVALSGIAIGDQTNLSESFVGTLLNAVSTFLPELIVSIAAVRRKPSL
ncbi:MAG: hypothetical protein V5A59_04805, partial [Bacteroidales bacterium]